MPKGARLRALLAVFSWVAKPGPGLPPLLTVGAQPGVLRTPPSMLPLGGARSMLFASSASNDCECTNTLAHNVSFGACCARGVFGF